MGGKWVCVNTYLVFRGKNSVYTHCSGGKSQYILIFPGGKQSIYSFFRGENVYGGKNEYVTPDLPLCLSTGPLWPGGSIFLPKINFYDGFLLMWCNFDILTTCIPKFPEHVCLTACRPIRSTSCRAQVEGPHS